MKRVIRRFHNDEGGEDLIEYGLVAASAASIAVAAINSDPLALKPALVTAFRKAKTVLDNG